MKLSVIIPCYNASETIVFQLEALANQRWSEPWEVIVVDNRSTDDSMAIVEQYRGRLPNLRIVDAYGRQSQAYALNIGVQAAAGEALAICDADDKVAPGWVAAMGAALSKYGFVAGSLKADELNESWVQRVRRCPQQDGLQEYTYPPYMPHAAGSNIGFKRSVYEAVSGFDESVPVLHDTDYCWRVQLAGMRIHFEPNAVVQYRFRHTVGGIYRQSRAYGESNALLYKRYRSLGMPKLSWKKGARKWVRLLRRLPQIRSKEGLARWIWKFGMRMGRLQGSIKYRVLAL